jgi:hypothetical protein
MPVSTNARTMARCRKLGWPCHKVEQWLPYANCRRDMWGIFDVLALDEHPGVLAIQSTSGAGDPMKHARKMQESPELRIWLKRGNRAQIWGWRKTKEPGMTRALWNARVLTFALTSGSISVTAS